MSRFFFLGCCHSEHGENLRRRKNETNNIEASMFSHEHDFLIQNHGTFIQKSHPAPQEDMFTPFFLLTCGSPTWSWGAASGDGTLAVYDIRKSGEKVGVLPWRNHPNKNGDFYVPNQTGKFCCKIIGWLFWCVGGAWLVSLTKYTFWCLLRKVE